MSWAVIPYEDEQHVVPRDDDQPHSFCGCACRPEASEDVPTVIVHNSFDGREAFESGERLPS